MLIFNEMPISVGIDVPDKTALMVTFDCNCNLKCYGCHYFKTRNSMEKINIDIANKKIAKIMKSGMIECIVLTGGEVTLIPNFLTYCKYLKSQYDVEIIVNTNGMNPSIIPAYLEVGIIFHVDVKMSNENFTSRKLIIGSTMSPDEYMKRLNLTLYYIYRDTSDEHILRTVDYPIEQICKADTNTRHSYSKSIEVMVNSLNSKYNKTLRWFLNDYYEVDDF
jgi:pyruvate-formate lyase-activating enzyme